MSSEEAPSQRTLTAFSVVASQDKNESPLHIAAREGFLNVVELFLAIPPATCEVLLDLTDSVRACRACPFLVESQTCCKVSVLVKYAGLRGSGHSGSICSMSLFKDKVDRTNRVLDSATADITR